jgi:hypothetical protein
VSIRSSDQLLALSEFMACQPGDLKTLPYFDYSFVTCCARYSLSLPSISGAALKGLKLKLTMTITSPDEAVGNPIGA